MMNTEKAIFLSPSDFQIGDIAFKAGLYQVDQLDNGHTHALIFTLVKAVDADLVERASLAEALEAEDDLSPVFDHALRRAVC